LDESTRAMATDSAKVIALRADAIFVVNRLCEKNSMDYNSSM